MQRYINSIKNMCTFARNNLHPRVCGQASHRARVHHLTHYYQVNKHKNRMICLVKKHI